MQGPKMISPPIVMLPPELMRGIISFAVGNPREYHAILALSQASQSFRQAALDLSWLFTEANWDRWPTPLLDLWCKRARTQPLTVSLSLLTIHRLALGGAPELKALLESYSQHWGTLAFEIRLQRSDEDERRIRFVERLLQCACPLLHTINGQAYYSAPSTEFRTLHLRPDCLPSLQTLHLYSIWPLFSASPTSVTELAHTCTRPMHWSPLLDAVKACRHIQRLTIDSWGYHEGNPITFPDASGKVVLPSLTLLELWGLAAKLSPAISQFLSYCDIPKLESLNIWVSARLPGVFRSLCQDLVTHRSCFCHARSQTD